MPSPPQVSDITHYRELRDDLYRLKSSYEYGKKTYASALNESEDLRTIVKEYVDKTKPDGTIGGTIGIFMGWWLGGGVLHSQWLNLLADIENWQEKVLRDRVEEERRIKEEEEQRLLRQEEERRVKAARQEEEERRMKPAREARLAELAEERRLNSVIDEYNRRSQRDANDWDYE